ncbi:MAG: T6SS immunity protein Tdi1 domain-containing protein [Myxococcota bacterium]
MFGLLSKDADLQPQQIDGATLSEAHENTPQELRAWWNRVGWGSFGQRFLRLGDLPEQRQALAEWLEGDVSNVLPLGYTGFGHMFYLRHDQKTITSIHVLDVLERSSHVIALDLEEFGSLFLDRKFLALFDWSLFEDAVQKHGSLQEGQVFCFVPALAAGGTKGVENLQAIPVALCWRALRQFG